MDKKNLVETVNTYSFSVYKIHKMLSITGEYLDSGLYEGRSPEEIKNKLPRTTETYFVKTTTTGKTIQKFCMRIESTNIKEYIFSAGLLRKKLDLEGYITSLNKEKNKYIITTTNKKE